MAAEGEIKGVDFSFARIPAATLVANGVRHVFRYLAYLPNGKVINKFEHDDDVAHGLIVHYNWETTATRPFDGAGAGSNDGHEAGRQLDMLGEPLTTPIIVSLDTDPRNPNTPWSSVRAYLDAFRSASGRPVGFYAGAAGIDVAATWGFVREFWQTAAWSGSYLSAHADYYQRIGHSWRIPGVADDAYDEDVIIHSGVTQPLKPTTTPTEVDMLIIAQKDVGAYLCGATSKPIKLPDLQSIKEFEDAGVKIVFVGATVFNAVAAAA
jgi:hypothetical protein